MGLAVNYMSQSNPNINKDADGRETISGFINDDPGLGLFIPVLRKNGQDVLYRTAEGKAKFVKSFVLDHQMNPDVRSNIAVGDIDLKSLPEEMTPVGLTNKRTIARIFRDKGVENVRVYEVRGVSHMGGETLPTGRNKDVQILRSRR